ncbi:hypothetical protein L7F22_061709 [Adiantum nelumboides]|nr:hypothetical protein [Adiantum nelumboides]
MPSTEVAPPSAEKKGKKTGSTPKKAKVPSAKKPNAPTVHPSYLQMISEAILALKERTGSSQFAITKYIESKYKTELPANFRKLVLVQLRNLVKQNKLVKVKGSYKLSPEVKKQVAPKKSRSRKAAAGEGEEKKAPPKKKAASAKKVVPKKAKSAKSPAKAAPAKKAAPKATKSTAKPAVKSEAAKKTAPSKKAAATQPKAFAKAAAKKIVKSPKAKPGAKKPAAKSPKAKKPTAKKAKKR